MIWEVKNMLKKYKQNLLILLFTILMTAGCSNKLNIINTKDDLNNKTIGVYTGSEYDTIAKDNIMKDLLRIVMHLRLILLNKICKMRLIVF